MERNELRISGDSKWKSREAFDYQQWRNEYCLLYTVDQLVLFLRDSTLSLTTHASRLDLQVWYPAELTISRKLTAHSFSLIKTQITI